MAAIISCRAKNIFRGCLLIYIVLEVQRRVSGRTDLILCGFYFNVLFGLRMFSPLAGFMKSLLCLACVNYCTKMVKSVDISLSFFILTMHEINNWFETHSHKPTLYYHLILQFLYLWVHCFGFMAVTLQLWFTLSTLTLSFDGRSRQLFTPIGIQHYVCSLCPCMPVFEGSCAF